MKQALLILLFIGLSFSFLQAQPVLTPRNLALGGGGSTYITDYNANFYNPANLIIKDREGTFMFGIGSAAVYLDAALGRSGIQDQWQNMQDHTRIYSAGDYSFNTGDRTKILDSNYPGTSTFSDNNLRYDATLFGLKWMRNNQAFSLAFRTRTSSNYRVGKGWYSSSYEQSNTNDNPIRDRSLIHRFQSLHEISFGYAESFQFLTGLTPRLDNFVIGIAPKLVLSGGYQNAVWNNIYEQHSQGNGYTQLDNFTYNAAGDFGNVTSSVQNGIAVSNAVQASFSETPFDINGIGAGLDIGVTYLLTLGSDLSAVNRNQRPTNRSLSLSFSMTDIGFVSYRDNPISFTSSTVTTFYESSPGELSTVNFIGARGQYTHFIQEFGESDPFTSASQSQESFSTLLPMALHGGAMLEIDRFKLMGDISVGLTNNAFNSTTVTSSIGVEVRPLIYLPLRGGVQFRGQRPEFLSFGTAIETRRWVFSISGILSPESLSDEFIIKGAAVSALQFYF